MELKTQALDRVLEALSPALAAELDRIVDETRQALEEEFQKRLQSAVRDAEAATRSAAEAQMVQSVADAREEARKQVTEELEKQFSSKLADTTAQLKNEASTERARLQNEASTERAQLQSEASTERARLQEQVDQWRVFAEAQRQLAEASSQSEILARFLKLARPFAAGLALYVTKKDGLALWKSRGEGAFPEIISQETTDPEAYFRAIRVRDKIVAAVCGASPFKSDALDFLSSSLERAIEVFGLKLRATGTKPIVQSETTVAAARPAAAATEPAPVAAAEQPVDQKAHADARRIARLLVSEIKLYHEDELREGREHSDIYTRLQKEIDHGRETYTQRVAGSVVAAHDYFHEELVRILGENDPSRLGATYPGPMNTQDV
jgi:hypothetical protein